MAWDEWTLESPSHNASNAGTMVRLSVDQWSHHLRDANPPQVPQGRNNAPIKVAAGMYTEAVKVAGFLSNQTAVDTAIWNPTIIAGASRTALNNSTEWRDLLEDSINDWWDETTSENWHLDGTPARRDGEARLRMGFKWNGSALVAKYVYGYVASIDFGPVPAAFKTSGKIPFVLEFHYARVKKSG